MCIIYTYYVIKRIATTTAVGWTISCLWCNNIIGDRYFIVFGFFLFGRKKNRKPKEKKQWETWFVTVLKSERSDIRSFFSKNFIGFDFFISRVFLKRVYFFFFLYPVTKYKMSIISRKLIESYYNFSIIDNNS